jgi:hypothetical protein
MNIPPYLNHKISDTVLVWISFCGLYGEKMGVTFYFLYKNERLTECHKMNKIKLLFKKRMDMLMKKHFRTLCAAILTLCCVISGTPVMAATVVSSFRATTEDALAVSENAKEIYHFLLYEMGLNSAAACGILANIRTESYFNPNALGDNGTSYGICQWHDTSTGKGRYTSLKNWCEKNGYDYTTLDGQLHYLQYELSQNNSSVLYNGKTIYDKMLTFENTAEGAYNAGYYWCNTFEVPYSNNPAKREAECQARGTLARDTYWSVYCEPTMTDVALVASGLKVSWEAFSGASQYELYRYTGDDRSTMELITTTTSLSAVDKTVESGNFYAYLLRAIILLSDGTTYTVNAKETTQYYLAAPTLTKCTGTSGGQTIKWNSVTGATGYIIFRSEDGGEYTRIASSDSTSYKDETALSSGTRYRYKVYACHDDGASEPVLSAGSGAIGNYTLAQPVITSATATENGLTLKWDKVAKAQSYTVYRSVDGAAYEKIATVTKKSYEDTDLSGNATVKYKIYAHYTGSSGQTSKSKASAAVKVSYLKTPTLNSVASTASKSITPKWSRNKKASGYEIQYSKSKSFKSGVTTLLIVTNDTTAWKITGLTKGTTYYVRVRSYVKGTSGKTYSAWSSVLSCKAK